MSRPSDGSVIGRPMPRKDSVASSGDRVRDLHGDDDDQRRQAVRQQVAEDDVAVAQGQAARRLDIFLAPLDQRRAAHGARVIGPLHRHQGEDDLARARAQHREQDERHQDGREAELDVDDAHDQPVDAAAEIGRRQADRGADQHGDHGAHHADAERDAQAVEDAREHVAALVVGAEPERVARHRLAARRHAAVHDVELVKVVGVLRRDQRRRQRGDDDQDEQRQAGQRQPARREIRNEAPERRLDLRRRPAFGRSCPTTVAMAQPFASASRTRGSSTE